MSMQWIEAGDCSRVPWWAPIASELRTAIRCQQRRGPRRGGDRGRGDGEGISSSGGGRQAAEDRSAAMGQVLVEQDGQQIVMLLLQGLEAPALLVSGGRGRGCRLRWCGCLSAT